MLKYDIRHLQKLRNRLDHDGKVKIGRAVDMTVKRMTDQAATYISRDIRKDYAIRASDIAFYLKIDRYYRDSTQALLYTGGGLHLDLFKPKVRNLRITATSSRGKKFTTHRRGVSLKIRKDRGRRNAKGAWYSWKSGRVLRRRDQTDNKSMPIEQRGPSVPGMVAHPETIEGAQRMIRNNFAQYFSDRLDYLLSQGR